MTRKRKRDNGYFIGRLKNEHPAIYEDLEAGRIPSVRQSLLLAGLKRPPSPINGLKREWGKASTTERRTFIDWFRHGSGLRTKSSPAVPPILPVPVTGPDGHLRQEVVERILCVMAIKGLKKGAACADMGLAAHDYRFPRALERREQPAPDVVRAIESWLLRNPLPAHLAGPAS